MVPVTKSCKKEESPECIPQPVKFLLPGKELGIGGFILVNVLRCVTFIYDLAYNMFYFFTWDSEAGRVLAKHQESKADVVSRGDGTCTWHSTRTLSEMHRELSKLKIDTMDKVFSLAIQKNGLKRCFGTRELLSEEDEVQANGKVFKKYVMGDYMWKSYNEVDNLARSFSGGLTTLGLKPKDKFCIFAETRAEWFISSIAAFKNNYTIVTLYATLGDEAIIHGLKETECTVIVTSHELLPKFKSILSHTPHVAHLIYMEHPLADTNTTGFPKNVSIHSFCDIIERGKHLSIKLEHPQPDDVAILMYTSGSTGVPKGVLLSHRNVASGMCGLTDVLSPVYPDDVYIGYLPLAHVLELMCEAICFLNGIPIGYSGTLTITDKSSKIKVGSKGDASVLCPTIMVSVPFALDRIAKGIHEQVAESSSLKKALFYYFYDYKLKWYYAGFKTPLTDEIIMKKAKGIVGGKVRVLITGGAPLAEATHEFVCNCLCVPVTQGYGLTETCASATCSTHGDMSTGRVGPPLRCCDIRLVDWEEGQYTVSDKPRPRGELVIGGDNVASGYYKLPDEEREVFFVEGGRRWFRTGDIAEVDPDGAFRVIDRKKDLVKLQMGEYLSLGKVESVLKTSPCIENICIYADPLESVCVAIIVPADKRLEAVAKGLGKTGDRKTLCSDPEIVGAFLAEVKKYGFDSKLDRFEIPMAIVLCPELWVPDAEDSLVTAAFKLKRRKIQQRFDSDIKSMYESLRI